MGEDVRTVPRCELLGAHVEAAPTAHCIYCREHVASLVSEAGSPECLLRAAGVPNWQNR